MCLQMGGASAVLCDFFESGFEIVVSEIGLELQVRDVAIAFPVDMAVLEGICGWMTEEFDAAKRGSAIGEVDFTES